MKDASDPLLLGMLFTHFLIFNRQIIMASIFMTELESSMVSYDRCLQVTYAPQEDQAPYSINLKDWPKIPSIEFKEYSLRYRY